MDGSAVMRQTASFSRTGSGGSRQACAVGAAILALRPWKKLLVLQSQEPVEQDHDREHVDHRAQSPHDHAAQCLVFQRTEPPEPAPRALKCAQDEVHDPRARMERSPDMRRWVDHGPPEEDGAPEEGEMLEIVEQAILQGRVVRRRQVPEPQNQGVAEPGDGHAGQGPPDPPQRSAADEEPSGPDASPRRQGPEERYQRVGEEEGRRRDGDEEHVLNHMGDEKAMREGVEGGEERQGETPEAGEGERGAPPRYELPRPPREAPPAGGIGGPEEQEQNQDSRPVRHREGPGPGHQGGRPGERRASRRWPTATSRASGGGPGSPPTRKRRSSPPGRGRTRAFRWRSKMHRYKSDTRPDSVLKRISNTRIARLRIARGIRMRSGLMVRVLLTHGEAVPEPAPVFEQVVDGPDGERGVDHE